MHDNTTNNDSIHDHELILTHIDEPLPLNNNVAGEHDYTLDDSNGHIQQANQRLFPSSISSNTESSSSIAHIHHSLSYHHEPTRCDDPNDNNDGDDDDDANDNDDDDDDYDVVHATMNHVVDGERQLHQSDNHIDCEGDVIEADENDFVDPTTTPNENDEYSASSKILDGEKMLEVTRKLFRSTERDPDRDLRKQVLLKTALRNLPHFVHYQQYNDETNQQHQYNINNNTNNNNNNDNDLNLMQQYNNHLQPNAIEVSTTSMRMLDLNDDYDQRDDFGQSVDKRQLHGQQHIHLDDADENEIRNHLEQNTLNQFDDILFNRHNSFDNLYQPNELTESSDEATNHINWSNIGYRIFEFPSIDAVSKVSKILDEELQDQQQHQQLDQVQIDDESLSNEPTLNQQSSIVTEPSPSLNCIAESLKSDTNDVQDDKEDGTKKRDSSNTLTNSFYPLSSSPRSYKRRSSRDYEDSMDIDLARASKLFETSPFGQFKRLRKNFENQSAPLIETTTGGF